MTKREMIDEIFGISGVKERADRALVDRAFERFMKKSKNIVGQHYNAVIKSKVTACFSIAVASGIFFEEPQQH